MKPLLLLSLAALTTSQPNSLECLSIVALASTADPESLFDGHGIANVTNSNSISTNSDTAFYDERERFECLLSPSYTLPIVGSETQLNDLREALHRGELVSSQTTLVGLGVDLTLFNSENIIDETATSIQDMMGDIKDAVVSLPTSDKWTFQSASNRHLSNRQLATYEGTKKVLVVRIIDKNGLVNPDPPSVMSDKIFGTNGDKYTMSSQFQACSFGKLQITNQYDVSIPQSAPGVVEVQTDVDIATNSIYSLRNGFTIATEAKLGISLVNSFDHVLYVVEKCYVECGWAGFAAVNSWWSVYHSHHYKSM